MSSIATAHPAWGPGATVSAPAVADRGHEAQAPARFDACSTSGTLSPRALARLAQRQVLERIDWTRAAVLGDVCGSGWVADVDIS